MKTTEASNQNAERWFRGCSLLRFIMVALASLSLLATKRLDAIATRRHAPSHKQPFLNRGEK